MEHIKIDERLKIVDFAFSLANISIFLTKEDAHFYEVNSFAHNSLGYTKDELMGMTLYDLDPNYSPDVWILYRQDLQNNESKHFVSKHLKKDGTYMDVDINLRFIMFNSIVLSCAFVTDITEKRKAEKEREILILELSRSNKEITQFNYITTHNLRAPITNLISICDLVKPSKIEDELTRQLFEGFKTSTNYLNETLNDLINILIIKDKINLSTEDVAFDEMLKKIKESLHFTLIKENVIIDADFSNAQSVLFNKVSLENIFINLLSNSIKFRHPNRAPYIIIKSSKDANGKVQIEFSDKGIGMNMERVKNKIFGMYQKFHINSTGKGIGLFLIQSQIEALGGKIEVTSEENIGTTFTILFS